MKFYQFLTIFAISLILFACNENSDKKVESELQEGQLFIPVDVAYGTHDVIIPDGFKYDIVFTEERDEVVNADGSRFPAKGSHDMAVYIPIDGSSENGMLYISHELKKSNPNLGDGGGASIFEVKKEGDTWKRVGDIYNVDFSPVGGTINNCGGKIAPNGLLYSAEEIYPESNSEIYLDGKGFLDTSDFDGRPRYQNFGWMVEVDPDTKKATRKIYAMGRYEHEDIIFMPDNKTVYLTDDYNPAVFFKFVADKENDYAEGQLYAYTEIPNVNSNGGNWITLPRDFDSLLIIRDVAMRMGATMYNRQEWMIIFDKKLYIAETGRDDFNWTKYMDLGGVPSMFLMAKAAISDTEFKDIYGRILVYDLQTEQMDLFLEGGVSKNDPTKCFSSPDCLATVKLNEKNYLVIHEDLTGLSQGRVSAEAEEKGWVHNEIYFLDMSIEKPQIDDLQRFMFAPLGCETTGGFFTPEGKSFIVNIQHPDRNNQPPFNRSATIIVTGF